MIEGLTYIAGAAGIAAVLAGAVGVAEGDTPHERVTMATGLACVAAAAVVAFAAALVALLLLLAGVASVVTGA